MDSYVKLRESAVWYSANLESLVERYRGRYVGIAGGKVVGDYADFNEGVDAMIEAGYEPGTFMVHLCVPREEETPWLCLSGRVDFSETKQ